MDLDGLKHVNQQIVKTAVENKAFENELDDIHNVYQGTLSYSVSANTNSWLEQQFKGIILIIYLR